MKQFCLIFVAIQVSALAAVDFDKQVRPLLDRSCMSCHYEKRALGKLRLDSRDAMLKGGVKGPAVVPGDAEKSLLYTTVKSGSMPPGPNKLSDTEKETLRAWIAEGARMPEAAPRLVVKLNDDASLVSMLHKRIVAGSKEKSAAQMKPYRGLIPGTDAAFEMVPIPGGEFTMGTPASEKGHKSDEAPQHKVKLEPFWMAKFEVTWDEYRLFQFAEKNGKQPDVDAVSTPTRPYVEMSFGMGINGYPAISMTQHAANKYAQWLSAKTGHFYRLPTEAEWEYACRAGSNEAYSFGAGEAQLGDYAWFTGNSDGKYQQVGKKKPNAWGLHDMMGNVMEWTLDQYSPEGYVQGKDGVAVSPWAKATEPYPHAVRGGSWNDPAEMLRCGARVMSDPSWKFQDPQLPKSIWYHTDAQWLGFRLVRPLKVPAAKEMEAYWNNGVAEDP